MAKLKGKYTGKFQEPTEETLNYEAGVILHGFGGNMFSDLGIDVETSERGRDASGKLRFYELTAEGNMKDPFDDGTTLQSVGFLNKVAQGKILAFPSGEKRPVQMQIPEAGSEIRYSKPLDSLPHLPKPQEPQRLSRWARFANAVTFGLAYRAETAEYRQKFETYQKDMQSWQEKQDSFREKVEERTPEVLDKETKQFEADYARREERERQEKLEAERDKAREQLKNLQSENPTYHVDVYRNTLQNYYGPKPVFHEEFCGNGAGKSYTQEQFDKLHDYS